MSGFTAVGFFLFSLFFGVIIYSLWVRIALRYLRISSLTQFSQLIATITDPLVSPFHLFKQKYKPGQKYDWVAFGTLILVEFIKIITLSLLVFHAIIPVVFILLYVLADLIIQPCNLLFYAILIRVIMSYVNPRWQHPIADFLRLLTEPLLILGRKIIPDISGFDFSPIIMMIILKIITLFISASLPWNLL
ncbi:YggT family protein [Legionella maioricensis]|uniref:YggT family protein n=1 Tax=Legionella maioricensis TaxID=2896528 RepID=A0A9X2I8G2_9GAMM|nr:YggT family protein [Legionella maioricensis]MCL9682759.1 YggT family protein [Legionella maioricensis]MCL9687193.1 YggT family protein [Legionella maioricensis]